MKTKRVREQRDLYLELIHRFPLRPVRSDEEADAATEVLDSLTDRLDDLAAEERDYLAILTDIIERYESATMPMPIVSDACILRHMIEAKGVTQAEAASATGIAISTISEVLSDRRKLTRAHIGKLAQYFNVEPNVFAFNA